MKKLVYDIFTLAAASTVVFVAAEEIKKAKERRKIRKILSDVFKSMSEGGNNE